MKRTWRKRAAVFVCLLAAMLWVGTVIRPWEPSYRWHPLSYWLEACLAPDVRARSTWLEGPSTCPEHVRSAFQVIGPKAVPSLLDRVQQRPWQVRIYASLPVEIQCRFAPPRDLEGYLLRNRVVLALSLVGPPVVPAIIPALAHPDPRVREVAVRALAFLGPESEAAAPNVIPLLQDPDGYVQMSALKAMRQMGTNRKQAIPTLMKLCEQSDENEDLLVETVGILGSIGSNARAAAPGLSEFLSDHLRPPRLREQAAAALWQITQDTNGLAYLVERLEQCRINWSQDPQTLSRVRWVAGPTEGPWEWNGDEKPVPGQRPEDIVEVDPTEVGEMEPDVLVVGRSSDDSNSFAACIRILRLFEEMGPMGKPAVPTILSLIKEPRFWPTCESLRPRLRSAGLAALSQINRESLKGEAGRR